MWQFLSASHQLVHPATKCYSQKPPETIRTKRVQNSSPFHRQSQTTNRRRSASAAEGSSCRTLEARNFRNASFLSLANLLRLHLMVNHRHIFDSRVQGLLGLATFFCLSAMGRVDDRFAESHKKSHKEIRGRMAESGLRHRF